MSRQTYLYRFTEGSTVITVTSSNRAETYDGEIYKPITIGMASNVESNQSAGRATLDIAGSIDNPDFLRWFNGNLKKVVTLKIYKKTDKKTKSVVTPWWSGTLVGFKPSSNEMVLTFDDGDGATQQTGLNEVFQKPCRWMLYRRGCFLDKADFAATGTISGINQNVVLVDIASAQPDGRYAGGLIEDSNGNLTFITQHIGNQLTLLEPIYGAELADAVTIYYGCDRSTKTCKDVFNNLDNHGGMPNIPSINIMTVFIA